MTCNRGTHRGLVLMSERKPVKVERIKGNYKQMVQQCQGSGAWAEGYEPVTINRYGMRVMVKKAHTPNTAMAAALKKAGMS